MAAAPQRRQRNRTSAGSTVRERDVSKRALRSTSKQQRRREASKGRTFVLLVVVPVLLMLGSVYAHTAAAGLGEEAARLEEEEFRAEDEGERLEVKVTELSEPGRIRALAKKDLGMKDPDGKDLQTTYGSSDGEDVVDGGGEKETGE